MKLLNTYEDREEAEAAAQKLTGDKRLASERDSTVVIYNLFGQPTWSNFYVLGMFNLAELKQIIEARRLSQNYNQRRHQEILSTLRYVESSFEIKIPQHWL